jgi:hypothetical protein
MHLRQTAVGGGVADDALGIELRSARVGHAGLVGSLLVGLHNADSLVVVVLVPVALDDVAAAVSAVDLVGGTASDAGVRGDERSEEGDEKSGDAVELHFGFGWVGGVCCLLLYVSEAGDPKCQSQGNMASSREHTVMKLF